MVHAKMLVDGEVEAEDVAVITWRSVPSRGQNHIFQLLRLSSITWFRMILVTARESEANVRKGHIHEPSTFDGWEEAFS